MSKIMGTTQPCRRRELVARALGVGLVLNACTIGLAACGSSGPSSGSYVGRASNAAIYVQWTRNGSKLTGELHQALLQNSSGQASMSNQAVPFTGTVSGSSVTLSLNQGLDSVTNLTGSMHGGQLLLSYPGQNNAVITVPMTSAGAAAYNADAGQLRVRAHRANVRFADEQAAQRRASQVEIDGQTVSQDIITLSNAVSEANGTGAVTPGLAETRLDVAKTLHEEQHVLAEAGHAPSYTVCADADNTSALADGVQADLDGLQGDQDSTGGDSGSITAAVTQLQRDAAVLQSDRIADPRDVPDNAPTRQLINAAIGAAKAKIRGETGTTGSAMSQGQSLYKTADGYANKARATCTTAGG